MPSCDPMHTSEDPVNTGMLSMKRNIKWCAFWDYRGAELLNMLLMLTFGIWLFSPYWNAFERCPDVYFVMKELGRLILPKDPELVWGSLFIVMAVLKFFVIWRGHPSGRKWTALISGMLWTTVTMTVGFSDYRAPMFPICFLLAFNMYRTFFCIKLR